MVAALPTWRWCSGMQSVSGAGAQHFFLVRKSSSRHEGSLRAHSVALGCVTCEVSTPARFQAVVARYFIFNVIGALRHLPLRAWQPSYCPTPPTLLPLCRAELPQPQERRVLSVEGLKQAAENLKQTAHSLWQRSGKEGMRCTGA